jgi:NAD(P)-dependent dehydrogenase (short-subunit alcohol dehydrogenase family)
MQDLQGKIALITGGASGVGKAIGARLVREGCRVILCDIDQGKLDAAVADIGAEAGLAADVTKEQAVEQLADTVFARFGAVHLLFNNAGVGLGEANRKIWTLPLNDWRWGIDVNVLGVVHGIKAFVPRMLASGEEGVVINTSSSNGGLRSLPNTPIYAASKAAVTSISEVLHQQLLREGTQVRAAILFPGPNTVNTSIMASNLVRPDEYAEGTSREVAYRTMQELVEKTGLKISLTEPEEVADFAVDGVKAGRFWLLPESETGDAMLRDRMTNILARVDPPSAW